MAAPIDARENRENKSESDHFQQLDDEADEWLFSSINDYRDLYMYDFQHPTRSMCWVSDNRVCVACLLPEKRSEVLEMILPDRLTAHYEDKALMRGRDFKVLSGGFHNRHIFDVQHIRNSRKILTTEKGENLIRIWRLGDEEYDVIEKDGEIHSSFCDSGPALLSASEDGRSALFGTALSNIQEVDLSTLEKQYSLTGISDATTLSGIEYQDTSTFATCGKMSGNIHVFDKRQRSDKHTVLLPTDKIEAPCVFSSSESNKGKFAVLDSGGSVTLWDVRIPKEPYCSVNVDLQNTRGDTIQIQFARFNSDTISVSGFDGHVYLYETKLWPQGQAVRPVVAPDFVHRGHEVCLEDNYQGTLTVLHHMWHSSQSQLVLSSASDGTLHAWNYESESRSSPQPNEETEKSELSSVSQTENPQKDVDRTEVSAGCETEKTSVCETGDSVEKIKLSPKCETEKDPN